MNTFNNDPNFSIIVPGGCNCNCSFCFNSGNNSLTLPLGDYLNNLIETLENLPEQFYQISITGGEPTISPYFIPIISALLPFKKKFHNILLTTNGTNLLVNSDIISAAVDHINISRHHADDEENKKIFNSPKYSLSTKDITEIINLYNKHGIDVSLNCVINDSTGRRFIENYIEYGKTVGSHAIRFRKENGTLDKTPAEKTFSDHKIVWEGACPVCRTTKQYINGQTVFWKSSTLEPSETLQDEIFEIVYQPDGKTYEDWNKKKEITVKDGGFNRGNRMDYLELNRFTSRTTETMSISSCGNPVASTCGGSSRSC
jgi:hypothetical protein